MPASDIAQRVGAVVVNYNAGELLGQCLASLRDNGLCDIVVVDNGSSDGSTQFAKRAEPPALLVGPGRNLGYGRAANLGVKSTTKELIFVCNPDVIVSPGAIELLARALDEDPGTAVAGPMLLEPDGSVYPSGRAFPGLGDALGHGFVGLFWPGNPWTRRYRLLGDDQHRRREADWVSGAGFLVRRAAFEAVGGFDEAYFMYVEDVDLCWRLHRAGWAVRYEPLASVVHEQGRSTSRHPYRMLAAHHRSILRFARRSTEGPERLLLPLVALALGGRFVLASLRCFGAGLGDKRASASSRSYTGSAVAASGDATGPRKDAGASSD